MSRELLAEVAEGASAHALARRTWSVWPVSVFAHVIMLGGLFVAPLVAPAVLPAVSSSLLLKVYVAPIEPPQPPPAPRRLSVSQVPDNLKSMSAAPVEAPTGVAPETGVETFARELAAMNAESDTVVGLHGGPLGEAVAALPPPPEAPIRVGGRIAPPVKIVHMNPVYPPIAVAARVEGVVIIEATIGRRGEVEDARVLRSVPLLDQAALDAVRQWKFTPTLLNGVPVRVIMTVTVQFVLKKGV